MYFSGLQGHGTSGCPGASGAPTLCMHGTTRCTLRSMILSAGSPIRAIVRMLTTTYGESVSCTAIRDIGESIVPMLKASTYIVRPAIAPANISRSRVRIWNGFSQLLVGPASSFDNEQTKVRDSTLATSLGSERA